MSSEQSRRHNRPSLPKGMPWQIPKDSARRPLKKEKPQEELPPQQPLTDEEEAPARKTPRWWKILRKILIAVALLLALCLAYLFLLLGEPDEDGQLALQSESMPITLPMSAVESPGESSVENLAEIFGQPVLCLYGSALTMERSRVYDTAYHGEYARRVTLTYAFDDGQKLLIESIRPAAAISLLRDGSYKLDGSALYYIGGMDAAWMENASAVCVFGQTADAAYAVQCPASHRAELQTLLKQTALIAAQE